MRRAADFCVSWTATDARRFGLQGVAIADACRAIDTGGALAAWQAMKQAGVRRVSSAALL